MTASMRSVQLATAAAQAASDKKATELVALDVSEQLVITDVFLVASGSNERQVRAIVDAVEERLDRLEAPLVRREGLEHARWVLLDFGDIVVHVQHEEDRQFYALERLWRDCPVLELDVHDPDAQPEQPPAGWDGGGAASADSMTT